MKVFTVPASELTSKDLRARAYGKGRYAPSVWAKIVRPAPPRCDMCGLVAQWIHPGGWMRCDRCPRPEQV